MDEKNRKLEDVLDLEHFDILVETDEDEPGFLDEMISGFEKNGRESLTQMYQAIEQGDFEQIKFHSHKLKGLSGTLGAKLLMERSSEIEKIATKGEGFEEIRDLSKDSQEFFQICLEFIKKRALSHE